MSDYGAFLNAKTQLCSNDGFKPIAMPSELFDFQASLVEWALWKGRAALFEDCGLGKTFQQLVWADNVVRHTNKPVLILTPLAVSYQTVAEAKKFGIDAVRSQDGTVSGERIIVTNYERLHMFSDPSQFGGIVCDESSILKSFTGSTKKAITAFSCKMRYRLLCTATAAPNDYIELGNSSEVLGHLGYPEMLSRFFFNNQNTMKPHRTGVAGTPHEHEEAKWRFKGHAERPFWQWVCSWARAVRRPSDLGFGDSRFVLPELIEREHIVSASTPPPGMLFQIPAVGLKEQRDERRRTVEDRADMAAELVSGDQPAIVWCHLNVEGDTLARSIPDAVQVAGANSDDEKEDALIAFAEGKIRVLITKPKIGALGLNFQHCAHMTTFPSHSFEAYYQGVRRCWRFGQKRPVVVDIITSEGERGVMGNLQRKARNAERMFQNLVTEMNNELNLRTGRNFATKTEVPSWL